MTSSGALVEEAPVVPQPAPAPSHNQPNATEPVTPTTSAGSGRDSSGDRGKQGQEQHQQQQQGEVETEQCEGEKIDKQMLDDKQQRTRVKELPDEYLNGQWDAEPFYYVTMANNSARNNGSNTTPNDGGEATRRRQKRGVIYKHRENMEYECFQSHEGVVYRPGDQVFVESSREEPWMIGAIVSFKMKKRDQLLVKLLRYYRPPDVPELSFSLITQERIEEGHFHATRQSHARELFSSDSALLFHISALRGKCTVKLVKDLRSALAEVNLADPDSFFHCLNYNQESGRLASVQMSIRVGSAHQADVPSCSTAAGISDEADRDELLYRPGYLCAETEVKYVKMARAFRTFSLINNKRITTLEKATRTGDLLLDDAITTLHRCKYNIVDGINEMQGNDEHLTSDSSFMSADDVKKFGKGIKTYGKAFNKINRDLLPHHRREQLVAFYYLWKKSRDATRPKPLSNAMKRNQAALIAAGTAAARRIKNGNGDNGTVATGAAATTPDGVTGAANCGGTITGGATWRSEMSNGGLDGIESLNAISLDDLMDYESASEIEAEQMESAERMPSRACHHCFGIKSKDWHHVGHERLLMCTDCRLFYKKYGQLRPVDRPRTVPPCLLSNTPARTTTTSPNGDDENEEPSAQTLPVNRIRTRGAGRQLLLQREQQRSRRTPSSLDGDRTTRRTPQRAIATAGGTEAAATEGTAESNGATTEQQRRSTPLRNATKSRKRAHREGTATTDSGTDQTPTPSSKDSKRHKKDNSALPSAASSRTPSPPQQQEDVKEANATVSNSGETSVPEESAAEQPLLLRRPDAEGNGTITPPAGTVATTTNSTGSISKSTELNLPSTAALSSAPNSPNEQLKENPPQNEPSSALATSKVSAPQALVKKPVAKVEPLDNTKKDGERDGATDQEEMLQSDSCCPATEQEDAMAVLEVEEDGVGQDMGPIGESDEAEGFRTTNKESLEEGKVTVLIRHLRRSNGLSCARTDLAYIEVPERRQWRERKTREASERTVRKSAGGGSGNNAPTMTDQKQLQMNSQQHKQFGNATGGGAKKMEMPSEFLPNGMTSVDAPPPSAAAVLAEPLMANPAIAMMNGLFVPPQAHPSLVSSTSASLHTNSASNSTAANNASTSSSSGHMANTALGSAGFAGGNRLPACAAAGYTHSQQQQSLASAHCQHQQQQQMMPGMATALLQQQQQQHAHDQQQQQAVLAAAAMQISAMGGAANAQHQQQLHNILMGMAQQQQQQPQQQYQHPLQQMFMHFAMQEQHQQQKMMELQRQQQQQQQQQKRATVAQQQQQQHSLLNGQHPHPLGHGAVIGQMQQQQQQPHAGHVFNGISAAQSAAHHQQQQPQQPKEQLHQQQQNHQQMLQQQQQSQQQNAAVAALMGQLFGAATFQQQQQQQAAIFALQQRAAAPPAVQQQQAPPPAHPTSALPSNTAQHIGTAQNGPNVAQQQQQAMMLLEMAAAAAMNPQQLMALMAGSGLDARILDELRGHLLNQQQQQQLTANAAAAQHQQQQQALAAQQQQAVQHQQQQMLAMLATSGALTPEHLQMAVIGQQQQNSAPALHTPSTSSSVQQQQHQMQQQMQQQMALAAIQQQQQAMATQQQHHHHNQQQQQQFVQIQQQMEMLRRMQQHHQEQQQQQR